MIDFKKTGTICLPTRPQFVIPGGHELGIFIFLGDRKFNESSDFMGVEGFKGTGGSSVRDVDLPGIYELLLSLGKYLNKRINSDCTDLMDRTDLLVGTDPLVAAEDIEAVRKSVQHLNDCPYSLIGLECALQPDERKVDFSYSVTRVLADEAISQGRPITKWFGDNDSRELERIKNFLVRWIDKRSLLYHSVYTVYLELDTSRVGDAGESAQVPGIFVRLQSGNRREEWYETMSLAVLSSLDVELTSGKRDFIRNYYKHFTGVCEYFQLGVMFSRADYPLKIIAMYVSSQEARRLLRKFDLDILEFVSEADWDAIVKFASGKFCLSLDFTDKLEKRIGIEIESSENDKALLDWLVGKGCCSIEKSTAVSNWSQRYSVLCPPDSDRVIAVEQKISHIKLVLQPNLPIKAKVYIMYCI